MKTSNKAQRSLFAFSCLALLTATSGCSDGTSPASADDGDGGLGSTNDSDGGTTGPQSDIDVEGGLTSPNGVECDSRSGDNDGDGFSIEEGDCNDCDVNANPGALDVPGNGVDENCDNIPDNQDNCDALVEQVTSLDALEGAQAIGLCSSATPENRHWGVISAKYTLADGSELSSPPSQAGFALLEGFGAQIEPREGTRLLSLSTGIADEPHADDPTWYARSGNQHQTSVSPPEGYPIASSACPDVTLSESPRANDSVALELEIRAPTNAESLSFDFNFFTYEFPDFVCHDFNDNFVVLMDPPPEGAQNGNISFDNKNNPISVNSAYLEVCDAEEAGLSEYDCPQGAGDLEGTGYEIVPSLKLGKGGATGWLNTTVPVEPGETFTLRFIIWDAGENLVGPPDAQMLVPDYVNDATVLIDNINFSAEPATGTFTRHITL